MIKEFNFTTPQVICDLQRKSQTAIRLRNRALFAGAATLICEYRDRMAIAERERKEMAEWLKNKYGCAHCKHWSIESLEALRNNAPKHPCSVCGKCEDKPNWKWKGGAKL